MRKIVYDLTELLISMHLFYNLTVKVTNFKVISLKEQKLFSLNY